MDWRGRQPEEMAPVGLVSLHLKISADKHLWNFKNDYFLVLLNLTREDLVHNAKLV